MLLPWYDRPRPAADAVRVPAALVYNALPADKRPPWLKEDRIEVGDTSACYGVFGMFYAASAARPTQTLPRPGL